jgi:LysM repeat protein
MSGRVVPRGAWSNPPEPRVRRVASRTHYRAVASSSSDGSTRHRVARGETASAIARQHGIGLMALLEANDMTMRSVIRPGDVLLIPGR